MAQETQPGIDNKRAKALGFPSSPEVRPLPQQRQQLPFGHITPSQQPGRPATPGQQSRPQPADRSAPVIPPAPAEGSQFALEPTRISPAVQSALRGYQNTGLLAQQQQANMAMATPPPSMGAMPAYLPMQGYGDLPDGLPDGLPTQPYQPGAVPVVDPAPPPPQWTSDDVAPPPEFVDQGPVSFIKDSNGDFVPVSAQERAKLMDDTSAEGDGADPSDATAMLDKAEGYLEDMASLWATDGVIHQTMKFEADRYLQREYDQLQSQMSETGGMFGAVGNPLMADQIAKRAEQHLILEARFAQQQAQALSQVSKGFESLGMSHLNKANQEMGIVVDALNMASELGLQAGSDEYMDFVIDALEKGGMQDTDLYDAMVTGVQEYTEIGDDYQSSVDNIKSKLKSISKIRGSDRRRGRKGEKQWQSIMKELEDMSLAEKKDFVERHKGILDQAIDLANEYWADKMRAILDEVL
jgi:hypothetical protein